MSEGEIEQCKSLTLKQFLFANKYVVHGNGTKAAIEARYSEKSAYAIASENLRKPKIKEAIQSIKDKAMDKLNITVEGVYSNVWEIANRKDDGVLGHALKANQMLGKDLGVFKDKSELDVEVGVKSHEEQLRELE